MAQIFDISMKITNELPKLIVTDDITVTINNRHNNILCVYAFEEENARKPEGEKLSDQQVIEKTLALLVGEKNAKEIEKLDLPFNEYLQLKNVIMEIAITGSYSEAESDTPK